MFLKFSGGQNVILLCEEGSRGESDFLDNIDTRLVVHNRTNKSEKLKTHLFKTMKNISLKYCSIQQALHLKSN